MSQQVQDMFSAIAPRYDLLNHLLSFGIDRSWRRQAVKLLNGKSQVLDLCAGTLDLSIELSRHSPQTQIDAVDFSHEMLRHGQAKLKGMLPHRIRTYCADALQLPFEANSYDGAMVAYGMRNLDDNEKALQEVKRTLRPEGLFVILDFFCPQQVLAKLIHASYGRHVLPLLGGLISGNKSAYRYLHDSIQEFFTVEEYKDLMVSCGFHNVEHKQQWGGASTLVYGYKK